MTDLDTKCKHCGRRRGDHKAGTLNCPATRHKFTHYLEDRFFEPVATRKPRRKFIIDKDLI